MPLFFVIGDPLTHGMNHHGPEHDNTKLTTSRLRYKMLLASKQGSDAVFSVGLDEKTAIPIPVHSFVLRQASKKFASMFDGSMKKEDKIRVKDFEPSAVHSLLRWMYCDELVFEAGNLYAVLQIAEFFLVHSLIIKVTKRVATIPCRPFIWTILSFAADHLLHPLADECLKVIRPKCRWLLKQSDFLQASESAVCMLVCDSDLRVGEAHLLEWSLKWAAKECERQGLNPETDRRQVMDSFIHEFAYPKLGFKRFASISRSSQFLTEAEKVQVYELMSGEAVGNPFREVARKC
jgi:hypothetical protein